MKAYIVECGIYSYTAIAENEAKAVEKVQQRYGLAHMPFTANEVDLEGYELKKKGGKNE